MLWLVEHATVRANVKPPSLDQVVPPGLKKRAETENRLPQARTARA
jgi:hypothetical protein